MLTYEWVAAVYTFIILSWCSPIGDTLVKRARRDLSLPGRRVHLLDFRTEERKKENLVYEKSQ